MPTKKITDFLEEETGGKSYKAHKYSLDTDDRPSVDYVDHSGNVWKETLETTKYRDYIDLTAYAAKLATSNTQLLTYFLDGSRHVYKVDHMGYTASGTGNRSEIFPIIAGQIGVGCCKRENRILLPEQFIREIVISVPDKADADGKPGFFPKLATTIGTYSNELKRLGIKIDAILPYSTSKTDNDKEFEDRATARIQDRMIEREKELVAELVKSGKLDQDHYLIKDGSLEYRKLEKTKSEDISSYDKRLRRFRSNYEWVLGVSKSFNPAVCKDVNGKENPGFIADLPLYHRTPVASFENGAWFGDIKYAVWYIRIRAKEKTRTPFDGIVKVEKMMVSAEEQTYGMNSELVDMLSSYIINERNPVCYGSDLRWANHIYPMYITESYVKSKYISTESFLQLF